MVGDSLGEFGVSVSAVRQRFLEAFRLRSEHAASIDTAMREALAARLIEEYGDPKAASDAVWALARENEWYREGEGAERFLLRRPAAVPSGTRPPSILLVAWHGLPVGTLSHDGFEWRWAAAKDGPGLPPVVRQTVPGKLPPFVVSLLPEGWLESVLKDYRDERALLRSGKRYMSNITIAATANDCRASCGHPGHQARGLHQRWTVHRHLRRPRQGHHRARLRASPGCSLRKRRNAAPVRRADQGPDAPGCGRKALAQRGAALHAHPQARRDRRFRGIAAHRMDRAGPGARRRASRAGGGARSHA